MRLPFALLFALLPTAAFAQSATPAVDLVAAFVLGARDNATVAMGNGELVATLIKTSPGNYSATPSGGPSFAFVVTEKSKCVFDVTFSRSGLMAGGIEIDANKLMGVTYDTLSEKDNWIDYKVTLIGSDGVVQELGPKGELAPISTSSSLSTSISVPDMQAAVAEFQKTYCPSASA